MNASRLLGWALLLFAAATSPAAFRLGGALGMAGHQGAWPMAVEDLMWALLAAGGAGLAVDRGWSRALAAATSACSLTLLAGALLVSIQMQTQFGMPPLLVRSALAWAAAGSLPLVALALAARKKA